MHLRTALRKSSVIAPIEAALRACDTQTELEDVWFDMADNFADESPERTALLAVYMERVGVFKRSEAAARMMRV